MRDRGRVRFDVSGEFLRQLLHLPDDVTLVCVHMPYDHGRETVEFTVEGPGLPAVPEGEYPPLVDPTTTKIGEEVVWNWNIDAPEIADVQRVQPPKPQVA